MEIKEEKKCRHFFLPLFIINPIILISVSFPNTLLQFSILSLSDLLTNNVVDG